MVLIRWHIQRRAGQFEEMSHCEMGIERCVGIVYCSICRESRTSCRYRFDTVMTFEAVKKVWLCLL